GLKSLGFELLLPPEEQSRILVAVREPAEAWYDFTTLHDALYAQGYTIYPGKAGRARCFRLAVLGDIDARDVAGFVRALSACVARARAGGAPPRPARRTSARRPTRNAARPGWPGRARARAGKRG